MGVHYQAVAEGVKTIRPEVVEALVPIADRHGLTYIPWGTGWLYETFPKAQSSERVKVPVDIKPAEMPDRRKPVDARREPAIDALLVYLWLTGVWRDTLVREVLRTLICFDCNIEKGVHPTPKCPNRTSQPICWGAGVARRPTLQRRIARILKELDVHRPRARPP